MFRKCFKKQWATFLLHPGIEYVRQLSPPPLPETIDPTAIVVVFAHKNSLNDFICHFCMPMNANNDFVIATRCCRSLHAERVLGRRLEQSWFKTLGKCSFWETPLLPMLQCSRSFNHPDPATQTKTPRNLREEKYRVAGGLLHLCIVLPQSNSGCRVSCSTWR